MRIKGIIRIMIIITIEFILLYELLGMEAASITCVGIICYGWLGEYIALWKERAVKCRYLNEYDTRKISLAFGMLAEEVKERNNIDICKVKVSMIPSEQVNAYAYGMHNIAITQGALETCDEVMLAAVMSHEIAHVLSMDAFFHRIIFANVVLAVIGLAVSCFAVTGGLWLLFGIFCLVGICRGCISIFFFSGISKMIKGIFELLQKFVLFIYQAVMGIVSRGNEFRADRYACSLGYGTQLKYFLSRFVSEQGGRTIRDILYASHPDTYKRIARIEQYREDKITEISRL